MIKQRSSVRAGGASHVEVQRVASSSRIVVSASALATTRLPKMATLVWWESLKGVRASWGGLRALPTIARCFVVSTASWTKTDDCRGPEGCSVRVNADGVDSKVTCDNSQSRVGDLCAAWRAVEAESGPPIGCSEAGDSVLECVDGRMTQLYRCARCGVEGGDVACEGRYARVGDACGRDVWGLLCNEASTAVLECRNGRFEVVGECPSGSICHNPATGSLCDRQLTGSN
jgi:hypothetical protein